MAAQARKPPQQANAPNSPVRGPKSRSKTGFTTHIVTPQRARQRHKPGNTLTSSALKRCLESSGSVSNVRDDQPLSHREKPAPRGRIESPSGAPTYRVTGSQSKNLNRDNELGTEIVATTPYGGTQDLTSATSTPHNMSSGEPSPKKRMNAPEDAEDNHMAEELEKLRKLDSYGEQNVVETVLWQIFHAKASLKSSQGQQIITLLEECVRSYESRFCELESRGAFLDWQGDLYESYIKLSRLSRECNDVVLDELAIGDDLHDFQSLHLDRYLFLYGNYLHKNDLDFIELRPLHGDFWYYAAERKRRWSDAFRRMQGYTWNELPSKLRNLYRLTLEQPESCLELIKYVNWDPVCPLLVGEEADDEVLLSKSKALEDLHMVENRIPLEYQHMVPLLKLAIGVFLEWEFGRFFIDCVDNAFFRSQLPKKPTSVKVQVIEPASELRIPEAFTGPKTQHNRSAHRQVDSNKFRNKSSNSLSSTVEDLSRMVVAATTSDKKPKARRICTDQPEEEYTCLHIGIGGSYED